jgi:hypothetical protein
MGPQGEFSRMGDPGSRLGPETDNLLKHDRASVAADLNDVLSCIGVRRTEIDEKGLVDRWFLCGVIDITQDKNPGLESPPCLSPGAKDLLGDLEGSRSAHPDDSQPSVP